MPSEQRDRVPRYGPGMVRVWSGGRLARRRSEMHMQFMTMFPMFAVRMRLGQSTLGLGQHGDLYRRSARADDLSRRADRAAHGLQIHAHTACAIVE